MPFLIFPSYYTADPATTMYGPPAGRLPVVVSGALSEAPDEIAARLSVAVVADALFAEPVDMLNARCVAVASRRHIAAMREADEDFAATLAARRRRELVTMH